MVLVEGSPTNVGEPSYSLSSLKNFGSAVSGGKNTEKRGTRIS